MTTMTLDEFQICLNNARIQFLRSQLFPTAEENLRRQQEKVTRQQKIAGLQLTLDILKQQIFFDQKNTDLNKAQSSRTSENNTP